MRKFIIAITAASVALPVALPASADAATRHRHHYTRTCHRGGTTGAIVGGGAGALVGHVVTGHGLAGPVIGAAGGALLGRHVQRHRHHNTCRR